MRALKPRPATPGNRLFHGRQKADAAAGRAAASNFGSPALRSTAGIVNLRQVLELGGDVGLLPREAAILVRLAAEMAVGGRARIDRLVEAEVRTDAARTQVHHFAEALL